MHTVEIEQTALLTPTQYKKLKTHLRKNFRHTGDHKRFMVRFIEDKVDVRNPLDIRYKWTSGHNELVIKKGALGAQSRDEVRIPLATQQFDHFVHLFMLLGYKQGLAIYRELEKFENQHIEVTLGKAGKHLFAEVESTCQKTRKEALKSLKDFFKELDLTPLSKAEYQKYLRMTDRKVNFHFDLKKYPKAFHASPYWKKILKMTHNST